FLWKRALLGIGNLFFPYVASFSSTLWSSTVGAILQTHFSSQMFLLGTQKQKILNVLKLRYLYSIIESESKEP
ncbi:hypothetical protein CFP56_031459, partial [Quercus suber]